MDFQWDLIKAEDELKTIPFVVEKLTLKDRFKEGPKHPYHRLKCPNWVNVLPITSNGEAVLIRQSRAGTLSNTLEIPGGVMDEGEKDPTMSAVRELEEETGLATNRIIPLGNINPNPAINNNRLHMFLALGCEPATDRQRFPDQGERIELVATDALELDELVRQGRIDSSLACLTIMLAGKYVKIRADD